MSKQRILAALSVVLTACSIETERVDVTGTHAALTAECVTLDFESTATGGPVERGDVLSDVYDGYGIDVRVWRGDDPTEQGLPVAFDSAHPTGGDWDLAFEGQGNLLISQESFDDGDVIAGYVEAPDDDARGAVFELSFAEAVCVNELTLLDIDVGEAPTDVVLLGDDDAEIQILSREPMGNNTRDVVPIDACGVRRIVVSIPRSGAVDDIVVCPGAATEEPPSPPPPHDGHRGAHGRRRGGHRGGHGGHHGGHGGHHGGHGGHHGGHGGHHGGHGGHHGGHGGHHGGHGGHHGGHGGHHGGCGPHGDDGTPPPTDNPDDTEDPDDTENPDDTEDPTDNPDDTEDPDDTEIPPSDVPPTDDTEDPDDTEVPPSDVPPTDDTEDPDDTEVPPGDDQG